jgi:hypothetical protein
VCFYIFFTSIIFKSSSMFCISDYKSSPRIKERFCFIYSKSIKFRPTISYSPSIILLCLLKSLLTNFSLIKKYCKPFFLYICLYSSSKRTIIWNHRISFFVYCYSLIRYFYTSFFYRSNNYSSLYLIC